MEGCCSYRPRPGEEAAADPRQLVELVKRGRRGTQNKINITQGIGGFMETPACEAFATSENSLFID
jgi:hypothetical protein